MDPLSIVASCIAVAGAGGTVVRGLRKLKDLRNIPEILLAVLNEIADLTLVIQEIKSSFQSNQTASTVPQTSISIVNQLFDRAQAILLELDQIINYRLILPPRDNGNVAFNRSAWISEERQVNRLQARLRTARLDIAATFAALNLLVPQSSKLIDYGVNFLTELSTRTNHLEIRIQELSILTESIRTSQLSDSNTFRLEQISQQEASKQLLRQLRRLRDSQDHNEGALRSLSDDLAMMRGSMLPARINGTTSQNTSQLLPSLTSSLMPQQGPLSDIVGVKVQQIITSPCLQKCSCRCHTRRQWRTPQILSQIIGRLFSGYSSIPSTAPSCDKAMCDRYQHVLATVLYVFPGWFLERILLIDVLYTKRDGPVATLRMMRIRPIASMVFYFTEMGNLAKVRLLFQKGEASPFDVSAELKMSQLQVCR